MSDLSCDRVRRHSTDAALQRIDTDTRQSIREAAQQPNTVLSERIEAIDQKWDIERTLETNASTLALTGAVLGLTVNPKWFLLTAGVTGFLLQHALTGWCPPVPVFRRLGVRTRSELDREKYALKALRGDFRHPMSSSVTAESALSATS